MHCQVRYVVEDGGHVNAGDAYAEMEVMKMIMTLRTKVREFFFLFCLFAGI
jgi:biotin carboxyl carrier protein